MTAVQLRGAVCLLGRFPALAGVDLDVAEREIVLCSGPNGAGKTTLLRLLAGLESLHSGAASVLGVDLAVDRRRARVAIAHVGHDTGCYDELSVRENAHFFTRAAGRPVAAVDEELERLGLTSVASVAHGQCSAGQRRRLSLAIALARAPQLLLFDEPHAGLDRDARDVVDAVIAAAPGEGRTVVFSSHELERARALCHREVEIRDGLVFGGVAVAAGTADARPVEPAVVA
ncbi:MAG: ATP-binding cassette domain-containing protein [Acidimicrobiia bacterium]